MTLRVVKTESLANERVNAGTVSAGGFLSLREEVVACPVCIALALYLDGSWS